MRRAGREPSMLAFRPTVPEEPEQARQCRQSQRARRCLRTNPEAGVDAAVVLYRAPSPPAPGTSPTRSGEAPQPARATGREVRAMRIVLVLSLAVIGAVVGVLITALQPGHQPWPLVGWPPAACWACGWPSPSSRAGADSRPAARGRWPFWAPTSQRNTAPGVADQGLGAPSAAWSATPGGTATPNRRASRARSCRSVALSG